MRAEMKKIYLLAHLEYEERLLKELQRFGRLHIASVKEEVEGEKIAEVFARESEFASAYDPRLSQAHHLIRFLESFEKRKTDPIENFVTLKRTVRLKEQEWQEHARQGLAYLDTIAEQCHALEERLDYIKARRAKLGELRANLETMAGLGLRLEEIRDTERTKVVLGSFRLPELRKFEKAAHSHSVCVAEVAAKPAGKNSGKATSQIVLVIYFKGDKGAEELLQKFNFSPLAIPDLGQFRGRPAEIMPEIDAELAGFMKEEATIKEDAQALLAKWKLSLYSAYDHLAIIYQQKDHAKRAVSSKKTFFIRAWCRKQDVAALKAVAHKATEGNVEILVRDPTAVNHPPVLLENPGFLKPFEIVTRTFSLPAYEGLDPTPFLAPFFFIFTGVCLTDAAYGIFLAVLCFFLARRYEQLRNFFTLLMYVGISTAIIGALIGGWLCGLIPIQPLVFDSFKNPLVFLGLALALGFIQLIFGIIIRMYENILYKRYLDALFDQVFWLGLIFSILGFGLASAGALPGSIGGPASYACILFALGLVATQGRSEKNIIQKLIGGVVSLYNLISYLADVLSYSRLLALGMVTGVIGLIVNQIAGLTLAIPFIGIFIAVLIIIAGHLFNIAISLMGAYIHSSRLQYVEFFGKFFQAGGKKFIPFQEEREYTKTTANTRTEQKQ